MTTPNDTLFPDQWHFNLIGDIETIWDQYTGRDVNIGIFADGIQFTHTDLDNNYNNTLQIVDDAGVAVSAAPNLTNNDALGTAAAGIIAAELNGDGTVGIAYRASITGVNILDATTYGFLGFTTSIGQSAFLHVIDQAASFDIMTNVWSKTAAFDLSKSQTTIGSFDYLYLQELEQNMSEGRLGLGTVVVQAAGDDGIDANGSSINASRLTISVAATQSDGSATELTNIGSSILIAAPAANITTDLIGDNGYNATGITEPTGADPLTDTDYTSVFGGTPAAASVVSGVIALMLDANADLGWRDIQNILAISAAHTGSAIGATAVGFERSGWFVNGAGNWNGGGMSINASYGYGIIDAFAAVRMAEVWSILNETPLTSLNEQTGTAFATEFSTGLAIPGNNTEVSFTISSTIDIAVEHIRLNLDFEHPFIGDLKVFLTDPSGHKIQLVYDSNTPTSFNGTWSYGITSFLG
ncbi:MAG: S8 family serine peptidase, partial [Proteobacteria bacterium]|nr:S8 family serine peptidase [Pseudomonadota bacterium]